VRSGTWFFPSLDEGYGQGTVAERSEVGGGFHVGRYAVYFRDPPNTFADGKIWVARFDEAARTSDSMVTIQPMDQTGFRRTTGISRFVLDWYT
jgi:hypothetical protein